MQKFKFSIRKNSIIALSFIVLSFAGCSKGGDSPTPTPPTPPPVVIVESDIAFKVDVAGTEVNYSTVLPVVGATVAINANITSALPKDGVTIDISVKKKADNTAVVFTTNLSSSAASNPVTITGLAAGTWCVATVTITSKSKSSNTATKTFELASK